MNNYRRILIVRLDRIGDVLLSTPVIKAMRDACPNAHIAFMAAPHARDILEGNSYLNEVILYDKRGRERTLNGNIKFIMRLREEKFDLAVVLHPNNRSHIITFLAGIPIRIGYDRKMGFLLTKRIPHTKQFGLKHEIDYNLDLLRYIGIESGDSSLYMPIREECEYRARDLFRESGIKETDLCIVMNPGASCPSKRWNPERFAKVGDALVSRYDAKVIVISGVTDKVFGDKVASLMNNRCLNLSGRTTVGDTASILKRAALFISNDSGPVHIACAVGTPVIVIFGRSDHGLSPERWGPSGKKDTVFHKDVGCDTCLAHNCEIGFKCLEAITPEEVLRAAEKILGNKEAKEKI